MNKYVIVTILSILSALVLLIANIDSTNICEGSRECRRDVINFGEMLLYIPIALLFALVSIVLKREIFSHWWKFARIAIPLIFVLSYILSLELHHQRGGYLSFDYELDFLLNIIMYGVFTIGSIIQIVRGYRVDK